MSVIMAGNGGAAEYKIDSTCINKCQFTLGYDKSTKNCILCSPPLVMDKMIVNPES